MNRLLTPVLGFTFRDTISKTQVDLFVPEVWANRVLGRLESECPMIASVRRDFSDEIAKEGDTVKIPKTGTISVNPKVAGQPVTLQNPSGTTVDVVLDEHKEVSFLVEDVAEAQSCTSVIDAYINDSVSAVSEDIEGALLAEYANVNGSHVIGLSAPIDEDDFLAARTMIKVDGKSGSQPLYAIVRDLAELLTVDNFIDKNKMTGTSLEAGTVGSIASFVVKETSLCHVTLSPSQTHRMLFARDGLALVTRALPMPPANTGATGAVVNKNGVGLRVLRGYNMSYLGLQVTVDILYGTKIVRQEWIAVIE